MRLPTNRNQRSPIGAALAFRSAVTKIGPLMVLLVACDLSAPDGSLPDDIAFVVDAPAQESADDDVAAAARRIANNKEVGPATRLALSVMLREVDGRVTELRERERAAQERLQAIDERLAALGNGEVAPPLPAIPEPKNPDISLSEVASRQSRLFAAEAQLRAAKDQLNLRNIDFEEARHQARGVRELYRRGYTSGARDAAAQDEKTIAETQLSGAYHRIQELQVQVKIAEMELSELTGDARYNDYIDLCEHYETMWVGRCGQIAARLEAAKVQRDAAQRTLDGTERLIEWATKSRAGLLLKQYQTERRTQQIVLFGRLASVKSIEDDHTLCRLNARQFFLMREEMTRVGEALARQEEAVREKEFAVESGERRLERRRATRQ